METVNYFGIDTYELLSGLKPRSDVIVKFENNVSSEAQGKALLAFEKHLRELTKLDIRVFKDKMGDDSKLRIRMTQIERDKL